MFCPLPLVQTSLTFVEAYEVREFKIAHATNPAAYICGLMHGCRDVEVSELAARLQARSAEVASAQQTAREAARTASEAEAQRAAAQTLLDAQRFLQDKGHADGILHSTHPAADSRRSAEYVVQHTPASVAMQMAVAGRTAADTADGRDQDVQMHEGHSPDASVSGSTMQASTTTASLSLRALQEQLAEVMVVNASLEAANASLQQQLQAAEIQLQQQAEQQRQLARCADLELSAMKAKVHELQAALSAAQAEFEASGQAAAAAAAALQQARSASAASDGVNQVKALEKQLCHYREQVAALQSELARSMQQLSEAQTLVAAAEASVQAHATQLSVLETELEQARTAGGLQAGIGSAAVLLPLLPLLLPACCPFSMGAPNICSAVFFKESFCSTNCIDRAYLLFAQNAPTFQAPIQHAITCTVTSYQT